VFGAVQSSKARKDAKSANDKAIDQANERAKAAQKLEADKLEAAKTVALAQTAAAPAFDVSSLLPIGILAGASLLGVALISRR